MKLDRVYFHLDLPGRGVVIRKLAIFCFSILNLFCFDNVTERLLVSEE